MCVDAAGQVRGGVRTFARVGTMSKEELFDEDNTPLEDRLDTQTIALRVIASILVIGAAYLLTGLLVPLVLALFVAIALTPVASWLEQRVRFPRTLAALTCALGVGMFFVGIASLVAYQAGTIVQDSDRYINQFGTFLASASKQTGGDRFLQSLGVTQSEPQPDADSAEAAGAGSEGARSGAEASEGPQQEGFYTEFLQRNLRSATGWVVQGIGGLLGLLGGFVVFIAYIYYMLDTRDEWLKSIRVAGRRLGMRISIGRLRSLREQMVTYLGYLFLVSVCYAVVMTVALWLIGVPQPLLWGVLTGFLEVVPYFGPIVAATLPTVVALSLGTWWQPLAVVAIYVVLQTIEGYVIAPLLYGSAVRINPVTIIAGLLFFGWMWGPVGLMAAMPMMILIRGFIVMSPDTPALDALVAQGEKSENESPEPAATRS